MGTRLVAAFANSPGPLTWLSLPLSSSIYRSGEYVAIDGSVGGFEIGGMCASRSVESQRPAEWIAAGGCEVKVLAVDGHAHSLQAATDNVAGSVEVDPAID